MPTWCDPGCKAFAMSSLPSNSLCRRRRCCFPLPSVAIAALSAKGDRQIQHIVSACHFATALQSLCCMLHGPLAEGSGSAVACECPLALYIAVVTPAPKLSARRAWVSRPLLPADLSTELFTCCFLCIVS